MSRRSQVYTLDESTRAELERRIVSAGYGGYLDHAEWLAGLGHNLSPKALQRYGQQLRQTVEADRVRTVEATAEAVARIRQTIEMSRTIADAGGGDPVAVAERSAETVLSRLYKIIGRDETDAATLKTVSTSISNIIRTVAVFRDERTLREAAERAVQAGRRTGVCPETLDAIRAAIEGPAAA